MPTEVYSPSIAEVLTMYDPRPAQSMATPNPSEEIVLLATAVFDAVGARVYDAHRMLVAQMAAELHGNFWLAPVQERMPFPDAVLYSIASMIRREKETGRRADWILWLEDDVVPPKTLWSELRASADPEKRPFVVVVGHDRYPPFKPAVWDLRNGKLEQWVSVPDSGCYEVGACGLTAALFHRSLFDRVPEPWFGITARSLRDIGGKTNVTTGFKPDTLWSQRLRTLGIPIWVDCGPIVTHMGMPLPVNSRTAPIFRDMRFMERETLERITRGQLEPGDSGPVHASVRSSPPQGVDVAHEAGDAPGQDTSAGEPGYFLRP